MIEQLYPLYYDELVRFLTGLLHSRAAAEDAAQETFLRALSHAEQLMDMDRPACRAWLYRTAKRICIDRCRRARRAEPLTEAAAEAAGEDDLSRVAVAELLGRLPPHEQALFVLSAFEGYTARELAELFEPFAAVDATYGALRRLPGRRLRELPQAYVDAALLARSPDGVALEDCLTVELAADIPPETIERQLAFSGCGRVICTREQAAAVAMVSEAAGMIGPCDAAGEDGGMDGANTVNAVSYAF